MSQSFNDLCETFRNRLKPFHSMAIVDAALRTLRRRFSTKLDELQQMPWHTLLIVKWALQDEMMLGLGNRPISDDEFLALRQHLHLLGEQIAKHSGMSVHLFIRRLVHPQIPFQREFSIGFMREAALINALQENHRLKLQFRQRVGLTPEQFLDLSFVTYTAIMEGQLSLPFTWFEPIRKGVGDSVLDAFYRLVSRDYSELKTFCRSMPDQNPHVTSEYFESTPLRRYPFYRHVNGLECWHSAVFYRGMEGLVHFALSEAGVDYIRPFSDIFEKHVVNEAFNTGAVAYREEELQGLLGNDKKVPDGLLSFPEANVFIEAKAGLFDESVMTIGSGDRLKNDTYALRRAISQGWAAAAGLRRNIATPQQVRNAPVDYLLIVTNRDLEASHGTRLKQMYPDGKLEYPSELAERYLSLERIYILSVDEFERLVAAARRREIYIPAVLANCVESDLDPRTSKYVFEQHLTHQGIRRGWSDIVTFAMEQSSVRVTALLSNC